MAKAIQLKKITPRILYKDIFLMLCFIITAVGSAIHHFGIHHTRVGNPACQIIVILEGLNINIVI